MFPAEPLAAIGMESFDVFVFSRTASRREGAVAVAALPRLAASVVRPEGAVAYECEGGVDSQGRPTLRLHLHGTLALRCDRCAEELAWQLDCERVFFFVRSEADLAEIPVDDAPEEPLVGSTHFDLAALIEDEAILQLPISPRHRGCAAPSTGEPVAAGDDEGGAQRPHPFAELARLRKNGGVR